MQDILPSDDEIELAADLLINEYGLSKQALTGLFGREQRDEIDGILSVINGNRLGLYDLAKLVILRRGSELFAGSSEQVRNLRLKLLNCLSDEDICEMFRVFKPNERGISSPSHMRRPLAWSKWSPGGPWPTAFVETLGFPEIFAGIKQRNNLATIEDYEPRRMPPELKPFQVELKNRMLEVLELEGSTTRCVVTLPTGGGKTRVAVEAFIDWMQKRFAEGKYLIWIAQSEELCEQALACIRDMWGSREYMESLRIYRYYGGRDVPERMLRGGVVVASIQQLYKRIESGDMSLKKMLTNTGAMIIDEAHRAVTMMYDVLLKEAEMLSGPDLFPICGLSATPGRTGILNGSEGEAKKLVGRFDAYLIKPTLNGMYENDPVKYFRDQRYLARARHIVCDTHREYELSDKELEQMELENDIPSAFRQRLAWDRERNKYIIQRLLDVRKGCPTLVYSCTVEHAHLLTTILNASGKKAAAISSDTPMTIRRGVINGFKDGRIQFLCNYGVLTTGFDAPKTECIALCRPTTSEILYEQIIGRGLRGPEFGGTEECLIMDFADNIRRLGRSLAYARFDYLWN